jgi:hypothetical protein
MTKANCAASPAQKNKSAKALRDPVHCFGLSNAANRKKYVAGTKYFESPRAPKMSTDNAPRTHHGIQNDPMRIPPKIAKDNPIFSIVQNIPESHGQSPDLR